jgi:hypothetical protein
MAFIRHLPCDKCGSKDNMGEFANGYFCFGCGFSKGKKDLKSLRARLVKNDEVEKQNKELIEVFKELDKEAVKWLLKYGITFKEMEQFSWCTRKFVPSRNREVGCRMLVLYHDKDYWQARVFDDFGGKYDGAGKKPLLFYENGAIVSTPTKPTLVFVEDIVSAVKVSRFCTSSPLLGASVPLETILRCLEHSFTSVMVWMDRDKAKESLKAAKQASQILGNVRSVITELDPKCLSDEEIRRIVNE